MGLNSIFINLLVLSLIIMMTPVLLELPIKDANSTGKVNYLALGNSLAAGQTPDETISKGYADYIADNLVEAGYKVFFDKRYAVPGYRTDQVLADITNSIKKDLNGNTDTVGIQGYLALANIITLDAGANDLLQIINIDKDNGSVTFKPEDIQKAMTDLSANMGKIITVIKTINPNAKIYLMGYYNPLPALPPASEVLVKEMIVNINNILAQIARQANIAYIPTAEAMAKHATEYLPNPKDIHPGEAGYRLLADLFWEVIEQDLISGKNSNVSYGMTRTLY